MPSAAPNLTNDVDQQLQALASQLRKRREQLGVSATALAASANLSRVTLHRIERGNPSVTVGAWLNVAQALGTQLTLATNPIKPQAKPVNADTNQRIDLNQYAQLRSLAWHLPAAQHIDPAQAFALYERNWRHVDTDILSTAEQALIDQLTQSEGCGILLV